MAYQPIVAPVVALIAWTMVMMAWMYAVRLPALNRHGLGLKGRVGSRPGMLDGVVEDQVQWKAHNYNHLTEQPTLFYAVCFALIALGSGSAWINLLLAWAYVALRVAHSLVQATVNVVLWRFALFAAGSFCLLGLVANASVRVLRAAAGTG